MSNLNYNKVTIGGRLTKKPELLKINNSDTAISNFTVAVTRATKQEGQPDADFFNCTAFNKTAEFLCKYFDKGSSILIEGRLQTRSYTKNDGTKAYVTETIVSNIFFVDSKADKSVQTPYGEAQLVEVSQDEPLPL